ncbi:MAG: hypothetical protein HRU15_09680 [Planctomycetes bacterium]|nr:hypothetical protein [Planctomycetota bacterium]
MNNIIIVSVLLVLFLSMVGCAITRPVVSTDEIEHKTIHTLSANAQYAPKFIGYASIGQPKSGKAIKCLRAYDGRIYVGCGNWNENTGPILTVSYNPLEHAFVCGPALATEAIDEMRVVDHSLIIPETDHTGWFWGYSDIHMYNGAEWSSVRLPRAVHIFDVADFQEQMYVAYQFNAKKKTEAYNRIAVVKNGSLVDAKSFEQNRYGRLWKLVCCGKWLYAFPQQGVAAMRFDGTSWQKWNGIKTGRARPFRAETSGSAAVILSGQFALNRSKQICLVSSGAYVINEDGDKVAVIKEFTMPVDVKFHDGTFFLLNREAENGQASIYSSTDALQWQRILGFTSDSPPTSLEVMDESLYLGLRNGEFWTLKKN